MPVIEPVGQTTPTHILGQHLLFLRCCQPVLCLQLLQQFDRSHIVGIPLTGCTNAQIIVGDAEITALTAGNLRQQHRSSGPCPGFGRRGSHQLLRRYDGFLDPLHHIQHFLVLPSGYLSVVLHDGIDAILAVDKIQTAGERLSGVHGTQRLHLCGRQCPVSIQRFLQSGVFRDVQRTTLLNILSHIEMIDKNGRLGGIQRLSLGSVGQQCRLGFLQRIEATGRGCTGAGFGIVAVMVVEITVGIAQDLDPLVVGKEACHVFCHSAVDSHLLQLRIRKGNEVLKGEGFQLFFDEFFQGSVAAAVNDDTIHIAVQAELHEVDIDLNGDFIVRDGGMSDRDIPKIKEITGGIKFGLAIGIDQFCCLCKQRMGCDAVSGKIGIVGHIHPFGHGALLKNKAGRDGFSGSVTIEGKGNRNAAIQTFLDFFGKIRFADIFCGIGNGTAGGKIIDPAHHGDRSHIHNGQILQLQMPQLFLQQFFHTGILFRFGGNTINFGNNRSIEKVCIHRNGVQFVLRQGGGNGNEVSIRLHGEVLSIFLLDELPDQPLRFQSVSRFHIERYIRYSFRHLFNRPEVLIVERIFFQKVKELLPGIGLVEQRKCRVEQGNFLVTQR